MQHWKRSCQFKCCHLTSHDMRCWSWWVRLWSTESYCDDLGICFLMIGRETWWLEDYILSYWEGNFSGAMLNFGGLKRKKADHSHPPEIEHRLSKKLCCFVCHVFPFSKIFASFRSSLRSSNNRRPNATIAWSSSPAPWVVLSVRPGAWRWDENGRENGSWKILRSGRSSQWVTWWKFDSFLVVKMMWIVYSNWGDSLCWKRGCKFRGYINPTVMNGVK